MSDVNCPYCGSGQEINHDDGYGYEEDEQHEQQCRDCGKDFLYTTSISYFYSAECQPSDHKMVPYGEKFPHMFVCENCDYSERREIKTQSNALSTAQSEA